MVCNRSLRSIWYICALVLTAMSLIQAAEASQDAQGQTGPVQLESSGLPANSLRSQEPTDGVAGTADNEIGSISAELQARLVQLQADTEYPAEAKELLNKLYLQTQADLKIATQAKQKTLEWTNRVNAAPALLEAAKRTKEDNQNAPLPNDQNDLAGMSYDEAQLQLRKLEATLATATAERTKLADEVIAREKKRKELPQLISDAQSKIEQLKNQPAAVGATDDALLTEARGWSTTAARLSLETQHQALEAELRGYEAEALLLPLRLEVTAASEKRLSERVRSVSENLSERRKNRITSFAIEFQQYSQIDSAALDRIRTWLKPNSNNEESSDEKSSLTWARLAESQAEIMVETEAAQAELNRWKDRRAKMDGRVETKSGQEGVSGFNSWVGLILRNQRSELPDPNQQAARIRYYQSEIQRADLLLFDLEDASLKLKSLLETRPNDSDPTWLAMMKSSEEIIAAMRADVGAYQNGLYALADIREQTRQRTFEYRDFIDKHVLWIRSCDPLNKTDIKMAWEAAQWLIDSHNWVQLSFTVRQDALNRPWWYVLFLAGMAVLIGNQTRLRKRLSELSLRADKKSCTDFSLTGRALLLSVLIALPLPLFLLFTLWRLNAACDSPLLTLKDTEFDMAIAMGCWLAAAFMIPLEFLRGLCRPNGIGNKHFGWSPSITSLLRLNLRRLIHLSIPFVILVGILVAQTNARWESSLGRAMFILLMPILSIFFARVFVPSQGVLSGFIRQNQGGWLDRLWFLWYPALCLLPFALVIASAVGYFYTSQRFASHLIAMFWLAVGLLVLHSTLKRWLVVSRRKLIIAQARTRLEQAAARLPGSSAPIKAADDEEVNLVAINEQTKRLLTSLVGVAGFVMTYFIWQDVMPAISLLNEVPLWTVHGATPEDDVIIALSNLVLVVPIVAIVVIASRNVPGLLEIALLQHLPLTKAARYAITTLARYAIVGIGIVVVSSTIGLQWSSIQWLVAALGVGLGFGLQEIFANFVSGIILLFEQPIRVGDIITVDGVTGSVSRIRMRATTIQNWDRQELVIPNKDLISGKLLNWTLSDTTNRITLSVGVAYGSDVAAACALIQEVCKEREDVMQVPPASVTFETFGDNSLTLVLRVFLASLDNRLATVHALHSDIYAAFQQAGIEIAFPQRDLHLKSLPASLNQWMQARSESAKGTDLI